MSTTLLFQSHLVLGYVAWVLCFGAYLWPRLKAMEPVAAHRAIATLHSFRFFGLVFILPGVVSPDLPPHFAVFAAYADLATGLLAMAALVTARMPVFFWGFVVAFNLVGAGDFILDYVHAIEVDLPSQAGEMGAAYAIPVLFVPILMITHIAAFVMLWRSRPLRAARALR
jgi:hypothetical protein